MAFGTGNIISVRNNRNLQNDYKSRANTKREALKAYLSKARRTGSIITDHLSASERAEVRTRLKSMKTRGLIGNLTVLILTIALLYSMVSYLS